MYMLNFTPVQHIRGRHRADCGHGGRAGFRPSSLRVWNVTHNVGFYFPTPPLFKENRLSVLPISENILIKYKNKNALLELLG